MLKGSVSSLFIPGVVLALIVAFFVARGWETETSPVQVPTGPEPVAEVPAQGSVPYKDLIRLDYLAPEAQITSPLLVKGEARGTWYFEGSFPVILTDWDGKIIAQGVAQAKGDWMSTDYVPFEVTLDYSVDTTVSNRGSLILKKDNPSGLPENDDALEISVFFTE